MGGLSYYEEQRDLRLELQPEAYPEQETIEMQTSTGGVSRFIRSDKISFDADGESVQLTLYKDPESGDYFLPFADGTSGRETYGAGRYLDVQMLPDGKVLVDFNYAYNPYCAYNDSWMCPITPPENRVNAPVRAGEKNFDR